MRRREFLRLAGYAAAVAPLAALGQQSTMPVIGFLNGQSSDTFARFSAAFRQGLSENGFADGQNVFIEYRWANGQIDRLPGLAANFVDRPVNVLFTGGSLESSLAAKAATSTIPIVFVTGSDPVKYGLVASLNRPGGNVTGIAFLVNELISKRLELLQKLIPGATLIGMLVNPDNPTAEQDTRNAKDAAAALGLKLQIADVRTERDFEPAFAAAIKDNTAALSVSSDPFFNNKRDIVVALAARYRLPTIYELRDSVAAGGLISYGTDVREAYRQAGIYVARILKGEKPSDLPVMQPTKFELVINLNTAKALGITVPNTLLVAADEVIE